MLYRYPKNVLLFAILVFFQTMAFLSLALSVIALFLLLTEQAHARPAITAPPTPTMAGCEFDGKFYQFSEVIKRGSAL